MCDWLNKSYCFQLIYMALAIDTVDGQGLNNEACCELLPKEEQGNAVFAVYYTVKIV